MADFSSFLENLTTPNNAVRAAAESEYDRLKGDPSSRLPFLLLNCLQNASTKNNIRVLSAVLLRRLLIQDEDSGYHKMAATEQSQLKTGLLTILAAERDPYLKARICDIVGELAGYILEPADWPEIVPYTYSIIQSADALEKETGLALMGMIADRVVEIMAAQNSFPAAAALFDRCLSDESDYGKVMIAAIRSLGSVVPIIPDESQVALFEKLVPTIMNGLQKLVKASVDGTLSATAAATYVETLIEMAEDEHHFFDSHLALTYEASTSIFEHKAVPISLRHLCLEFVITLCTNSPKKTRKISGPTGGKALHAKGPCWFSSRVLPLCVEMMKDIADDAQWDVATIPEDSVESSTESDIGEVAVYRMCAALGLGSSWIVMSQLIESLLNGEASSPDSWRSLHAGLRVLGNYLEVSKAIADKGQLAQHRSDVVKMLARFVRHPHPRVRAACFYALGEFFLMHGATLTAERVDEFLPVIVEGINLSMNPQPRVRRQVLLCLINLIDRVPASAIERRGGIILQGVAQALQDGPTFVQEVCLQVLISLAETVKGPAIAEYYDAIIPCLKRMLAVAHASSDDILWARGVECCAIVGESAGRVKFYADAIEMMKFLSELQTDTFGGNEAEIKKYLLKAWIRIARCLGEEFVPFMPIIMSHLFEAMTQDVTATDIDDPEDVEDRSDIQMVESDKGWVAVRTAAVEEQVSACQLVVLLVERLQEHFYPFVQETVTTMSTLLDSIHEDVRAFCVVVMPELVRATAKASSPDRGPTVLLVNFILGRLIDSITTESLSELIMTGLQSIKLCLSYACTDWAALKAQYISSGEDYSCLSTQEPPRITPQTSTPFLNEAQMKALTDCLTIIIRDSLQRRAILRAEAQVSGGADENDVADENIFLAEYMEVQYNVAEVVGAIFRTHGSLYFPTYMSVWHQIVESMSEDHCLKEDKQFAYAVMSELIEFGLSPSDFVGTNQALATEFLSSAIPRICSSCTSPEVGVRQTCAYTVGVLADKYPSIFLPHGMTALQALAGCISAGEDPPSEMRGASTDNAAASIGILLEKMEKAGISANYPFLWKQFLSYGPLRHDKEECCKILKLLCRLITSQFPHLTHSEESLSLCVTILLQAVDEDLCGQLVVIEIAHCLRHIKSTFPSPHNMVIDQSMTRFPPTLSSKLSEVFTRIETQSRGGSKFDSSTTTVHDVFVGSS